MKRIDKMMKMKEERATIYIFFSPRSQAPRQALLFVSLLVDVLLYNCCVFLSFDFLIINPTCLSYLTAALF